MCVGVQVVHCVFTPAASEHITCCFGHHLFISIAHIGVFGQRYAFERYQDDRILLLRTAQIGDIAQGGFLAEPLHSIYVRMCRDLCKYPGRLWTHV